ncbi:uncharacterized protein SPPG_02396 [Spizellomyces punctatus DAOM BR117]|uniref:Uncharacterized protein n=1 Tax=Spizellomyces punctatus (strain DAOM BR117) TaxID=645134 RepID=A0A0L0HQK9_SPIPD|nr:uncharacterized protein SPPG_02396 [Spizellomyces punctatus DAOM BR117]KND03353.1 hypothetical protein SPPG_02396 [Spizellomyces punctatus DAOM BR117]|eukprot:XP_016611392.1 hypothetical protein SPPG_02396 [Spizellomyces punctatus DAOM BR117]
MSESLNIPVVPYWKDWVKRGGTWEDWKAKLQSVRAELAVWESRTDLDRSSKRSVQKRKIAWEKANAVNHIDWAKADDRQVQNTRLLLETQRYSLPSFASTYNTTAQGVFFPLEERKRSATPPSQTQDFKRPRLLPGTEDSDDDDSDDVLETDTDEQDMEIPGLEKVLKGSDITLPNDLTISNVNCARLIRLVMRDILLDQQKPVHDRTFAKNDCVKIVSLKRGILLTKRLPEAYAPYITCQEWSQVYQSMAPDTFWDVIAQSPSTSIVDAVHEFETSKINEEDSETCSIPPFSGLARDEAVALQALYSHVDMDAPEPEHEASFTSKYVMPHFNRLKQKRWKMLLDTTMVDRLRPDITIKAGSRPVLLVELKAPYAASSKRNLQLGEGLTRGLQFLKSDLVEYDWESQNPQIYTAIAPDGVNFQIYSIQIREQICFFVQLGKIPIVTCLDNIANLPRALVGFTHLRSIVARHVENIRSQSKRNVFHPPPEAHTTPDKSRLLENLRTVYPSAITPDKLVAKRRGSAT